MQNKLPTYTAKEHLDYISGVLNRELNNREHRHRLQIDGYAPIEEIRAAIESVAALRLTNQ